MREPQLSELQLDIMRVLWRAGEMTASGVHEALLPSRPLAPTTVATLLSRLARRGLLTHRVEGRQYFYRPAVSEPEVRRSMVAALTTRLFGGDATELVSHLLASEEFTKGDLERVRALLKGRSTSRKEKAR
jgi:predicted transcriptional regulator